MHRRDTAEPARNEKLEYLRHLLDFYHSKGDGEFINSKIRAIGGKQNNIFCIGCARTFILTVNCTARQESARLEIECNYCGTRTSLDNSMCCSTRPA